MRPPRQRADASAPRPHSFRAGALTLALLLGALLAGGCDEAPFEPFAEEQGDRHYSVFGYLNASADTQWVRVELLRDSLLLGSGEGALKGTRVRLEHLGTGRTAELRDSLFAYSGNRETARAHNFWATGMALPVEPLESYRLTVRGPGGAETSAQVSLPDTFPTPVILTAPDPDADLPSCDYWGTIALMSVKVRGIERLAAVNAVYYPLAGQAYKEHFGHLADTVHAPDGSVHAVFDWGRDWCEMQRPPLQRIEVVAAAGDPDWPDYLSLDREGQANPGAISNVEGGAGVFGGGVTDTVVAYDSEVD